MSQDFDDFDDENYDLEDRDVVTAEDEIFADEDEFDRLRRKSARSETMDDELAFDEELPASDSSGSGFSLSNFTSTQRLVLALLVLLDILAIGFALLVITGRFS